MRELICTFIFENYIFLFLFHYLKQKNTRIYFIIFIKRNKYRGKFEILICLGILCNIFSQLTKCNKKF